MLINKKLFGKKEASEKRDNENDDYKIKTGKKTDIVIRILSLLAAVIIWAAVININTAEYTFTDVSVLPANYTITNYTGYEKDWSVDFVDVKVKGKKSVIDALTSSSVSASIDFSQINIEDITSGYEARLKINIKLPEGVTVINMSEEYVTVKFISKIQ